jgi:hypothetical protein
MTENTARTRAVAELLAQRREADRPPTARFARTGQKKAPPAARRGPMPDANRAAREAAWRRDAAGKPSLQLTDAARPERAALLTKFSYTPETWPG